MVHEAMTRQPESSETVTSELIRTSFDVERDKWAQFELLSRSLHRSRGAQIRELIDRALAEHDREEMAA